jgi:outer membrane protein OmpA-like peptidoglycan-associated protein
LNGTQALNQRSSTRGADNQIRPQYTGIDRAVALRAWNHEEADLPDLPLRIVSALVKYRFVALAGTLATAITLPLWTNVAAGQSPDGRIIVAESADQKKKREEEQRRQQQQQQQKKQDAQKAIQQQKQDAQRALEQRKLEAQKKQQQQQQQQQKQDAQKAIQQKQDAQRALEQRKLEAQKKQQQQQQQQKQDAQKAIQQQKQDAQKAIQQKKQEVQKAIEQQKLEVQKKQDQKKQEVQKAIQQKQDAQKAIQQKQDGQKAIPQKKQDAQTKQPPPAAGKPKFVPQQGQFVQKKGPAAQNVQKGNVDQIKQKRKVEVVGGQRIVIEPGNRRIIHAGNRIIIRNDDSARLRRWGNARFEVRGRERYTTVQRGPYQIVTVTDADGRLIRRYRRYPNGREVIFIDNRPRFGRTAVGVGAAALFLGLAAPAITIPRNRYVVDAGDAPPALLYETLEAPPVVAMERPYTLDEVRYNVELRDRVRSIDLNTINFSSGSWEITPEQYPQLQAIAEAILKVLAENADAVIMIEGHTDAVGTAEDNLSLSDRRAEAVAEVLTGQFQIPPENLVTQGYGEQHLRVQTDGASRENRRVQIRNITQILGEAPDQDPNAPQEQPPG